MQANYKTACVFGGTGFAGRQIVRELARAGYIVKVASRAPESAYFLKTAGQVGQIVPFACDYSDAQDLCKAVRGCDVVVNCVGILAEKEKSSFTAIHTDLPREIAAACQAEHAGRFIHLSALGCDAGISRYAKSKKAGEEAIFMQYPLATVLRPSVMFGAEDRFFNRFARLSMVLPFLPLIGGGKTRFQPVYVGDVADSVMAVIAQEETKGRIYELGGAEIVTFREIYDILARQTGRRPCLISLPWGLAKFQGMVLGLLPGALLTADQVDGLKTDSVVAPPALGLRDLGLHPATMEVVLPSYLAIYRPGGRFGNKKRT